MSEDVCTVSERSLKVTAYRDQLGQPTCALDFWHGKVCVFLRTYHLGCVDTCVFAGEREVLERYENTQMLQPLPTCPVWKSS